MRRFPLRACVAECVTVLAAACGSPGAGAPADAAAVPDPAGSPDAPAAGDPGSPAEVVAAPGYAPARERLLAEVLKPDALDHPAVAYGLVTPLPAGQAVGAFPPGTTEDVLEEESFFFWIDDAPGSLFAHASRFVYVGTASGAVRVVDRDFWPVIGGEAPFGLGDGLPPGAEEVFRSPAAPPPDGSAAGEMPAAVEAPAARAARATGIAARTAALTFADAENDCGDGQDPPRYYTVLVSGAGRGRRLMSTNLNDMASALYDLGVDTDLSEQGGRHYVVDASIHEDARSRLSKHFSAIKNKVRCCDRLLVYVVSHGVRLMIMADEDGSNPTALCYLRNRDKTGQTEKDETTDNCYDLQGNAIPYPDDKTPFPKAKRYWGLEIGDKLVAGEMLAGWIKNLKTCHATVIVDACYSGGLVADLAKVPGVRHVITSTAANETREYDPEAFGTTFSQAMLKGLSDLDAGGIPPDLLWTNAFGAQQTKYDPFARSGDDHPQVAQGELACDCLCPDGIAVCCFKACDVDAWGGCLNPCGDFCDPFAAQAKPGKCAVSCASKFGLSPFPCADIPKLASECIQQECPSQI